MAPATIKRRSEGDSHVAAPKRSCGEPEKVEALLESLMMYDLVQVAAAGRWDEDATRRLEKLCDKFRATLDSIRSSRSARRRCHRVSEVFAATGAPEASPLTAGVFVAGANTDHDRLEDNNKNGTDVSSSLEEGKGVTRRRITVARRIDKLGGKRVHALLRKASLRNPHLVLR